MRVEFARSDWSGSERARAARIIIDDTVLIRHAQHHRVGAGARFCFAYGGSGHALHRGTVGARLAVKTV